MIINVIKPDGSFEKVIHNATLIDFIYDEFSSKPHFVYRGSPSECSMESLIDKTDKEAFLDSEGEYTVVETAGGAVAALYVIFAVAVAYAVYMYNNIEFPDTGSQDQGSNNSLRGRQNRERPLQRIEDIAGKVRSYPTLIQQVYKKFDVTNTEVEYSLMCISKGEGEITDVKDSETPINMISGSGACFYAPYTMPSVDVPFQVEGEEFQEPVKVVIRSNEVSGGITLDFPGDENFVRGGNTFKFSYDSATGIGSIHSYKYGKDTNRKFHYFMQNIGLGNEVVIDATWSGGSISGTYVIQSFFDPSGIVFLGFTIVSPALGDVADVNPDWLLLTTTETQGNGLMQINNPNGANMAGPYFLAQADRTEFFANVVAEQGLQRDDKKALEVEFFCQYAQADSFGNQIGDWSPQIVQTLFGSTKDRIGTTFEVVTSFTGYCLVRFGRITDEIDDAQRQNISLDSLYSVSPITVENFGDVTTVQTRTITNSSSTQLRERKFNCEFKRKLNVINEDGSIGDYLPTDRFIDYFYYACISNEIGRRIPEEVNTAQLASRYQELVDHFGGDSAGKFSYTFDSDQVSFQQTLQVISDACFGKPFRYAGVISYKPELPGIERTSFTHRNKIPGNQVLTRTFESEGKKDGVEFQYVDPVTSEARTLKIPSDGSALRPEKVESKGVRNHDQAYWLAYRKYQKQRFQRIICNDTFTAEGSMLAVGDIVLITNNTRSMPQSGEVVASSGLVLKLSEPVFFTDGVNHSIALRMRNGTIDVIDVEPGVTQFDVVLARPPMEPVYTGYEEEKTTFIFSKDETFDEQKYIITEVNRNQQFEIPISAVNYTDKYYEFDGVQSPLNPPL